MNRPPLVRPDIFENQLINQFGPVALGGYQYLAHRVGHRYAQGMLMMLGASWVVVIGVTTENERARMGQRITDIANTAVNYVSEPFRTLNRQIDAAVDYFTHEVAQFNGHFDVQVENIPFDLLNGNNDFYEFLHERGITMPSEVTYGSQGQLTISQNGMSISTDGLLETAVDNMGQNSQYGPSVSISIRAGERNGSTATHGKFRMVNPQWTKSTYKYKDHKPKKGMNWNPRDCPQVSLHDARGTKFGQPGFGPLQSAPHKLLWFIPSTQNTEANYLDQITGKWTLALNQHNQLDFEMGRVKMDFMKNTYHFANANVQPCHFWIYDFICTQDSTIDGSISTYNTIFQKSFTDYNAQKLSSQWVGESAGQMVGYNQLGVKISDFGPFWDNYRIVNTTHVYMMPGHQHTHTTHFDLHMMKKDELKAITGNTSGSLLNGINLNQLAGKTHGILICAKGVLGEYNVAGTDLGAAAMTGCKLDFFHEWDTRFTYGTPTAEKVRIDLANNNTTMVYPANRTQVTVINEEDAIAEPGV